MRRSDSEWIKLVWINCSLKRLIAATPFKLQMFHTHLMGAQPVGLVMIMGPLMDVIVPIWMGKTLYLPLLRLLQVVIGLM